MNMIGLSKGLEMAEGFALSKVLWDKDLRRTGPQKLDASTIASMTYNNKKFLEFSLDRFKMTTI